MKGLKSKLFALFVLIPLIAHAGISNQLYLNNYEQFWVQWGEMKTASSDCTDSRKMAEFVSMAVEMLGNAEVTESNSKALEELLVANPSCILSGMDILPIATLEKAVGSFLVNPLFLSSGEVEKLLRNTLEVYNFSKVKRVYEGLSKNR